MKISFLKVVILSSYYNNLFKIRLIKIIMRKLIKIILGLILTAGTFLLVLSGMPLESWGTAAINLIKGGIILIIPLIGLILIIMGFSELRE